MSFTPSPQQQDFYSWIRTGNGSAVLEAVAGAGKTTTLVEGVKLMGGSVFLGAYNKTMAAELKARIKDIQGVRAGTFHSAGFSALCRVMPDLKLPGRVDDKKVRDIVRGLMPEAEEGWVPAVCQLVSLAKQTGFFVKGLVENVVPRYWLALVERHDVADRLPEDADINVLISMAARALEISNADRDIIDYDDMVYMPLLLNLRFYQNDWVLIDEAQDTNAVRREMARRMLRPRGRMVAVGDPHQAIYGFTGADNQSLEMIKQLFNAKTLKLSVSWRCAKNVVAVARQYVGHIEPSPTAQDGEVLAMGYSAMLDTVAAGNAVLCRFNAPLVDLCFRLIREGKAAKIEGKAIGEGLIAVINRWKVKTLDALENKLTKWLEREKGKIEAAPKLDESKLDRLMDQYDTLTVLIERAREQGVSTVEGLAEIVRSMFDSTDGQKNIIVLASVHKSKGMEWHKVFILGRGEIMPSPRAKQEWQKEQEINLCYVAVTRAKSVLVDVALPTDGELRNRKPKQEEQPA